MSSTVVPAIGTFVTRSPAHDVTNMLPMGRNLEPLTRTDAIRLLAGTSFGRVGVTIGALPAILPVNYAVFDESIVFRTAPGTKLAAAVRGAVVAFQVDAADAHVTTGWSVLVVGRAHEVTDSDTLDRVGALPLASWAPGARDHVVQIPLEIVTGRRITASVGDHHRD